MNVIREVADQDFPHILPLVYRAFQDAPHRDGTEHLLVERLWKSNDYHKDLTLVYEQDGLVVGFILFSPIFIGKQKAIALAPIAVHPQYQNQGIGSALIQEAHRIATKKNILCSVVLGDPCYYGRFGYRSCSFYSIEAPFSVDPSYFLVCFFQSSLTCQGRVRYSSAFNV